MQLRKLPLLGAALLGVGTVAIAQKLTEEEKPEAEVAPAAPEIGGEAVPEAVDAQAKTRELVRGLAADSYRERKAATDELWKLGDDALLLLEEAEKSDDPEVAYRSRILVQRIRTGITPGTPQKIIDLVQRYFKSGATEKKGIFEQLETEKAFMQMLRLYRFETDLAAREACGEILSKAVLPAVRSEIDGGRIEAAEDLLRLAPATDQNCRRLATLLRVQGTLEKELEATAKQMQLGPDGVLVQKPRQLDLANLRLALLRASGETAAARELAGKLDRPDLVAALALFEGDPVPYLSWFMSQQEKAPVIQIHAEIALKRWQGDEAGAAKLMKRLEELAKDGGRDQREALLSLMLNGYLDEALPIIERDHPDSAFGYYETTEQPRRALQSIGYTGDAEAKREWLEERLKPLRADWEDSDAARYDVLTLASFLQTRGEIEEARRLIRSLGEIAREEGESDWLEFIGRLNDMGGSLYELAFFLGSEWLEDKDAEKTVGRLIGALFTEGEAARRLWDRIEKLEQVPASKRIMILGALHGAVYLPQEELDRILKDLRALAAEAEPADRRQHLSDLLDAAEHRDDAGAGVSLLADLTEIEGKDSLARKLASYHGYVADWEKNSEALKTVLQIGPQDPAYVRFLARYAGARIRAGKPGEAQESLKKVELTGLDEPLPLLRLGVDLEVQGAMDKAAHYWRLLLLTNPPSDWYWQSATTYYSKHAKRNKQWRVAAAFAEVDALQYIRGRSTYMNPVTFLRKRFAADLFRGLALLEEGDEDNAKRILRHCFEMLNGDGLLADDYFPLLREAGMKEEHDRSFAIVEKRLEASIKEFPQAHNTYNSAAWMASRAARSLDGALKNIEKALAMRPRQAAYLDTMAEVWFAKRDREKATQWSRRALLESYHGGHSRSEGGVELRDQYDRFRFDGFPVE